MAALARSRSAVRYDLKGQPDDSTAWPNTFPARGNRSVRPWRGPSAWWHARTHITFEPVAVVSGLDDVAMVG